MSTLKTYKTEAVILKHVNWGEADRILTLYTPNYGKVRAVARGVRRVKSRLGGHVEPLTRCSLMLVRGRTLETVSQGQTVETFTSIRDDLRFTAHALYIAELVDVFTSEHDENYPVYSLLVDTLRILPKTRNLEILCRYFEIRLLTYVGYGPVLHSCVTCQRPLEPVQNYFSPSGGGVLCPDCAHTEPVVRPLSVDALKVLRVMQSGDYGTASRLRLNSALSEELEGTVQGYLRYLLEREIRSTTFLDRLKREIVPGPKR